MMSEIGNPSQPIGPFAIPRPLTEREVKGWIHDIRSFPEVLRAEVESLSEEELKFQYRTGGWNIGQIVHHCADSHMNSYIRFKWALTEENPLIKAYDQDTWIELPDMQSTPISVSLDLIKYLHARWVYLLEGLTANDLKRTFIHPETNNRVSLEVNTGIYSWHGRHHIGHIQWAKKLKLRD